MSYYYHKLFSVDGPLSFLQHLSAHQRNQVPPITQSDCSQIVVMIETNSGAGSSKRAYDLSMNTVQEVDLMN